MEEETTTGSGAEHRWKVLERETAELIAGKLTPRSGSGSIKGDVHSSLFVAEAKYRSSAPFILQVEWLEAVWEHARWDGRQPLLALEAWDGSRAIVIPISTYLELGAIVPNMGRVEPLRSFCVSYAVFHHLPISVTFTKIEVPETQWVILSWGEMLELRRSNEAQPERTSNWGSSSPLRGRPTHWTKPAPWRQRPFR